MIRHFASSLALVPLLFLSTLPAASPAIAEDEPSFSRSGGYLGIGGTYGFNLIEDQLKEALGAGGIPVTLGDSPGVNARAGYRLFSFLALEAHYEWLHRLPLRFEQAGGDLLDVGRFQSHVITANMKVYLPIWRIQPYLLAGGGVGIWTFDFNLTNPPLTADVTGTGFAGRLGAGVDLYVARGWALNVEGAAVLSTRQFELPSGTLDALYYFSLSGNLIYRF